MQNKATVHVADYFVKSLQIKTTHPQGRLMSLSLKKKTKQIKHNNGPTH